MKLIGIVFIGLLIYLSILFFLFDKNQNASRLNPYHEKSK